MQPFKRGKITIITNTIITDQTINMLLRPIRIYKIL